MNTYHTPMQAASGLEDSWNKENQDMSIGRSWSPCPRRVLWPRSNQSLETNVMPSSVDPVQPPSTCGKTPHGSPTHNLNSAVDLSAEIQKQIGRVFGNQQRRATSNASLRIFVFKVIGPYDRLHQTMINLLDMNESVLFFGVKLARANPEELGMKQESKLTVKIPAQSFGAVIKVKRMLSLVRI